MFTFGLHSFFFHRSWHERKRGRVEVEQKNKYWIWNNNIQTIVVVLFSHFHSLSLSISSLMLQDNGHIISYYTSMTLQIFTFLLWNVVNEDVEHPILVFFCFLFLSCFLFRWDSRLSLNFLLVYAISERFDEESWTLSISISRFWKNRGCLQAIYKSENYSQTLEWSSLCKEGKIAKRSRVGTCLVWC